MWGYVKKNIVCAEKICDLRHLWDRIYAAAATISFRTCFVVSGTKSNTTWLWMCSHETYCKGRKLGELLQTL